MQIIVQFSLLTLIVANPLLKLVLVPMVVILQVVVQMVTKRATMSLPSRSDNDPTPRPHRNVINTNRPDTPCFGVGVRAA